MPEYVGDISIASQDHEPLLSKWTEASIREILPNATEKFEKGCINSLKKLIEKKRVFILDVDGTIVSMAAISERTKTMQAINDVYNLDLSPVIYYPGSSSSDHGSFWIYGYTATVFGEAYWGGDFNDYYHTSNDRIIHFNLDYFHSLSKLAVASLSYLVLNSFPVQNESNVSVIGHYEKPVRIAKVKGHIAYIVTEDSLEVLDCSFPEFPVKTGGISAPYVSDFILHGDYILMIDTCFRIIDISSPSFPATIGTIEYLFCESLSAQGNYVYSVCPGGIFGHKDIIDISDPSNPIGILHMRGGGNVITVSGSKAYIVV